MDSFRPLDTGAAPPSGSAGSTKAAIAVQAVSVGLPASSLVLGRVGATGSDRVTVSPMAKELAAAQNPGETAEARHAAVAAPERLDFLRRAIAAQSFPISAAATAEAILCEEAHETYPGSAVGAAHTPASL